MEIQVNRGVNGMQKTSGSAARRNRTAISRFVTKLAEQSSGKKFNGHSAQAIELFSARANASMSELKSKCIAAKLSLGDVSARRASGELTDETEHAESAGAKVVLSMAEVLQVLYTRSKDFTDAKDIHVQRRIAVAAETLSRYVEDKLLQPETYPTDPTMHQLLANSTVSYARSAYNATVTALHNAPELKGVPVPEFPSAPVMH
jgi:hypothetical protein